MRILLNEMRDLLCDQIAPMVYHKVSSNAWTLFGIRACKIEVHEGDTYFVKTDNVFNKYDDLLILQKGDNLKGFLGTVDPGRKYTESPMVPGGCAHLLNGLHWFKPGPHKGIPAFVQAKPVRIWRDRNANNENDDGFEDEGWFGIDIHPGSGNPNRIDGWSAGCINSMGNAKSSSWLDLRDTVYKCSQVDFKKMLPVIVMDFPEAFA